MAIPRVRKISILVRLPSTDGVQCFNRDTVKQSRWRSITVALITFLAVSRTHSQEQDPKILESARKEGEVVWYTTMSLDQSKQFADHFHKKYPFVKPVVFRTGGGSLLNKVLTESSAGKYDWDVLQGTADMVASVMERKLLAPYFSPGRKLIDDDLKDIRGFWTSVYVNPVVLGYNTKLIKSEEVPRTYQDLLSPRWRGAKISVDDNYFTFMQGLIGAWGRDKAVTYFKMLAIQDPVIMGGTTLRVQLAAAGEFPLVIAYAPTIQSYTGRGAPLDWVPLEPVVVSVTTITLADKTRHPNAAKLFIDFSLSKEGQEKLWESARIPVRKDVEPRPPRLFRGYQRLVVHPDGYSNYKETMKVYNEIFKAR
jgi:iron(III) transport system substrate-binding protein